MLAPLDIDKAFRLFGVSCILSCETILISTFVGVFAVRPMARADSV